MNHQPKLTPAQLRCATLLARGLTYKETASQLSICPQTVNKHMATAFETAEVHSIIQLVRWLVKNDYLTVELWLAPNLPKDWACS